MPNSRRQVSEPLKNLPIFVQLKDKPVLVIGGGEVALRKIQTLLKAQANVTVVSHGFCPEVKAIHSNRLTLTTGDYNQNQLQDKWLVIAATDDQQLNQQVHDDAVSAKIFVNVVDDPKNCEFIFPAIIDRSPIVMAISSGGEAPVLARLWKEKFESLLPQWTGKLASLAGSYRTQVKQTITDFTARRQFWERFFRGDIASLASQGDWHGVEQNIQQTLVAKSEIAGSVYYVNIGDGTADNLTLKALQSMQLADEIYHDATMPEAILDLCRKDSSRHLINDEIVDLINADAAEGKIVCRLVKGHKTELQLANAESTKVQGSVAAGLTWVDGIVIED